MITRRTISVDVMGEEPLTENAVEHLRDSYVSQNINEPEELVIHPAFLYELRLMNDPHTISPDTFHGLQIVEDPKLLENGWYLRRTESITEAME